LEPISNREIATVHSEYNKHYTQRGKNREIRNKTIELLGKVISEGGLGIRRVIVVHTRPHKLKYLLQRAKVYKNKDRKASAYL
jgi:hypothetical protein